MLEERRCARDDELDLAFVAARDGFGHGALAVEHERHLGLAGVEPRYESLRGTSAGARLGSRRVPLTIMK